MLVAMIQQRVWTFFIVAVSAVALLPVLTLAVDDEYVEYKDVDGEYPYYHTSPPVCLPTDHEESGCLNPNDFVFNEFVVAGINLGSYRNPLVPSTSTTYMTRKGSHDNHDTEIPFLLYENFDIGDKITGNESWLDMIMIRRQLQRPSLAFYSDKVARKTWLAERRYPQPQIYFTNYKDNLMYDSGSKNKEELKDHILNLLPTEHGFCAKPTHMSMTFGAWLVDIDPTLQETAKFSKVAKQMKDDEVFNPKACADSLAEGLHREASMIESWILKQVRPGIIIEELYTNHLNRSYPPNEFCIFVIWGRVYVAQWNSVDEDRYLEGFIYRDGSSAKGCYWTERVPDWVPWDDMVALAEELSQGKDLFRVDFLVGVPRYSDLDTKPQFVVSESAIHPNTMFCNSYIADEMARLWVAGYKIGNYQIITNNEIPSEFRTKNSMIGEFSQNW